MKVSEAIKRLEDRCTKADMILATADPTDSQRIRMDNARLYKEELTYLIKSISYIDTTPIHIVPKATLEKKSAQADFASIEEDGYFYQLVLLQTYPFGKVYLLYVEPISEL